MLHTRQRQVRTKRTTLELETKRFTGQLDIMMQQFQSSFLFDPNPYDARTAKVRKSADAAKRHEKFAVLSGDRGKSGSEVVNSAVGHVAEELQRKMQAFFARPRRFRRRVPKRRRGSNHLRADVGR